MERRGGDTAEVTGGSEERAETRRETESGGERREFSGVM